MIALSKSIEQSDDDDEDDDDKVRERSLRADIVLDDVSELKFDDFSETLRSSSLSSSSSMYTTCVYL